MGLLSQVAGLAGPRTWINTARMVSDESAPRLSLAAVSTWSGVSPGVLGSWIEAGALPAVNDGWPPEIRDLVLALRDMTGMGIPLDLAVIFLTGAGLAPWPESAGTEWQPRPGSAS